ncbi:DUF748 domain-containing protein [Alteromonas sp. ASW11-130]|uniref:DUF748 domain-containing protein n=1 Tax=Alteromonas sp. ASW11-130 TaxID=3015775 RepID=UPI00224282DB|nr:DUF748 domain-containing protein [Alteromonas sp. ASW11-130]MCW8093298.1 DUF748 domain-containing protein [Alteromonas sp. ASW11-130]
MQSKIFSRWTTGFVIFLAVLIALRMALPYATEWYLNKMLSEEDGFAGKETPKAFVGQVGDVDIMLWRGAYSLENIELVKRNGKIQEPFIKVREVEFSLLWSALFDGALVGSIDLYQPELNFVDSKDKSKSQSGEDEKWLVLADQLFPLKIDMLKIHDGKVAFHNTDVKPEVHISLHDITLKAQNLVNSRDLSKDLVGRVEAQGEAASAGTIKLKGSLDPQTQKPTFDLDVKAEQIALVNFKNFLDTYAPFDLEAGSLDLALELASDNGEIKGYAKPILHNVEVFSWKGDIEQDNDGFFQGMVEMGSAFIAELLENQSKDQIATRIPIEGSIDSPDTPLIPTVLGILKNAFIQALKGDLENSVDLEQSTDPSEDSESDNNNEVEDKSQESQKEK